MFTFLTDRRIYDEVICRHICSAKRLLWLATSDLKDLHVNKRGKFVPFLEILSDLIRRKVEIRLLHAKEPGPLFRRDFDKYPNLIAGMERILCPRVHLKTVVIDSRLVYVGSANLTGAGMGIKSPAKRNFESAILTDDPKIVAEVMDHYDSIWRGAHCPPCRQKKFCSDYKDMLSK